MGGRRGAQPRARALLGLQAAGVHAQRAADGAREAESAADLQGLFEDNAEFGLGFRVAFDQRRDRAELLLREVNHRVGNSLQLVSSFMSLQMRHISDEGAREALRESQARIEAVAHVHRRLYTSGDMSRVAMDEYLQGLMDELSKSLGPGEGSPRLFVDAAPLWVTTDQAVSLGVVVAELVTNAVKYAYQPGQGGEIRISLKPDGEHRALLTVEDDGPGLGDGTPKGTGLGGKIISAMASGLRSAVEFDAAHKGVRAKLAFDL